VKEKREGESLASSIFVRKQPKAMERVRRKSAPRRTYVDGGRSRRNLRIVKRRRRFEEIWRASKGEVKRDKDTTSGRRREKGFTTHPREIEG